MFSSDLNIQDTQDAKYQELLAVIEKQQAQIKALTNGCGSVQSVSCPQ